MCCFSLFLSPRPSVRLRHLSRTVVLRPTTDWDWSACTRDWFTQCASIYPLFACFISCFSPKKNMSGRRRRAPGSGETRRTSCRSTSPSSSRCRRSTGCGGAATAGWAATTCSRCPSSTSCCPRGEVGFPMCSCLCRFSVCLCFFACLCLSGDALLRSCGAGALFERVVPVGGRETLPVCRGSR